MNGRAFRIAAFIALALPAAVQGQPCPWRAAWVSAQMRPNPADVLPDAGLGDLTLRQILRVSIAGSQMRIRISNAFGDGPLTVRGATVARSADPASARVVPGTLRALTFGGRKGAVVPPGGEWLSDPLIWPVAAFDDLAVTVQLVDAPRVQTSHPGSRATSYSAAGGAIDAIDMPQAKRIDHWYWLSGVETTNCAAGNGIVVLGDSITDGRGSTTNRNDRWPDGLARRLRGKVAVLNQGIGGNRVLLDGLGPNALARLDRDVLAQPGVGHLIVLEGVNDIGSLAREAPATTAQHAALVEQLTGAYAQIIARAGARGIKVHGATILPFMGNAYYHPDAATEADRQAVNAWIRTPGRFNSVIDFDRIMRDPARPAHLAPAYDTGDGLHPNPTGYRAMADAVSLATLR